METRQVIGIIYCNVSGRSTRGETPDRTRCDAQETGSCTALHRTAKDGEMARSCEPDRLSLEHGVGYGTVIGCADRSTDGLRLADACSGPYA